MNERENAGYWEENAADWTRLVRAGFDESRDRINNPSFFGLLPDVRGMRGLDVGCGEVVDEWGFGAARRQGITQRPFRIPYFMVPLAEWLNRVADAGLVIERVVEPRPDEAQLVGAEHLRWYGIVPWFLQVRARKP